MSESKNKNTLSRREMFTTGLRYMGLAALGAGGGAAIYNRKHQLRDGKCTSNGVCPNCDVSDRCGHPRAMSIRQKLSENSDD